VGSSKLRGDASINQNYIGFQKIEQNKNFMADRGGKAGEIGLYCRWYPRSPKKKRCRRSVIRFSEIIACLDGDLSMLDKAGKDIYLEQAN